MRLYIDKNNIESFIRSINSMPAEFEKCNLMLKKHFDMHLNLSKDDFAQSELCMSWANTLLDGRGKNIIHFDAPNKVFPQRPIDSTTFGGGFDEQQNCSVYLLEDYSVASTLEAKGNYLVGEVGKEINTLLQLIIGDEDELYTLSLPIRQHFSEGSWSGLSDAVLPCTDIIITDGYILSNPSLYKTNLVPLIKKLTTRVTYTRINIVIFCLRSTKDTKGNEHIPDWSNIRLLIKNELIAEGIDAYITFVVSDSTRDFKEHDRTIFTNYLYYASGATMNFYDKNGIFTSDGRHFTVHSQAKETYFVEAHNFLQDMQSLIIDIINKKKKGLINKDNAQKLSNFLHFS